MINLNKEKCTQKDNVNKSVNSFPVLFSNVDTLTADKFCELKLKLVDMEIEPKIIALQEVKPKNFRYERLLAEYNLDGYEFVHKNLVKGSPGRGLIIYVKNDIRFTQVTVNTEFNEYLSIEINLNQKDKVMFSSVYRSPSMSDVECKKLCKLFHEINTMKYTHCITVGDLNLPKIQWKDLSTTGGPEDFSFVL